MKKRKTHEEYVNELTIKNPTVEAVDQYIDAKTKITHHCLIHDVYWSAMPSNILKGCGCSECQKAKAGLKNGKTHEQYVKELHEKNPNIIVIGKYAGANTPTLHECVIDGYQWMARPANILSGKGCPKCAGNLQLTPQEYRERLYMVNPNIIALDDYAGAHVKIRFQCLMDGYIWSAQPNSVIRGCGCPKCAKNQIKTHEEYIHEVALVNPDIEVVEKYINAKTPILHRCKIDGYEWHASPTNILQGHKCLKCVGQAPITHDEYVERLLRANPDIEPLEKYSGAHIKILHKCKIDGYEWYITPANALRERGCPQCKESSGERRVRKWLEEHNVEYVYQKTFDDCKDRYKLPFDFYLPSYNTVFEVDGIQHFQPVDFAGKGEQWAQEHFELVKRHDDIKTQYCKNNNIDILRIPYYKNIEEELNKFLSI